jgi:hypothetical protein
MSGPSWLTVATDRYPAQLLVISVSQLGKKFKTDIETYSYSSEHMPSHDQQPFYESTLLHRKALSSWSNWELNIFHY